jgi:hypothetical protein
MQQQQQQKKYMVSFTCLGTHDVWVADHAAIFYHTLCTWQYQVNPAYAHNNKQQQCKPRFKRHGVWLADHAAVLYHTLCSQQHQINHASSSGSRSKCQFWRVQHSAVDIEAAKQQMSLHHISKAPSTGMPLIM